jgi:hypothetical protein
LVWLLNRIKEMDIGAIEVDLSASDIARATMAKVQHRRRSPGQD